MTGFTVSLQSSNESCQSFYLNIPNEAREVKDSHPCHRAEKVGPKPNS